MDSVDTPPDILPTTYHNDNTPNEQTTKNHPILDICNQVRKLLVENGINLSLDFPIIESERGGVIRGMFFCYPFYFTEHCSATALVVFYSPKNSPLF
jgi:hypothetical protein